MFHFIYCISSRKFVLFIASHLKQLVVKRDIKFLPGTKVPHEIARYHLSYMTYDAKKIC